VFNLLGTIVIDVGIIMDTYWRGVSDSKFAEIEAQRI
jgi:hypothetical protein